MRSWIKSRRLAAKLSLAFVSAAALCLVLELGLRARSPGRETGAVVEEPELGWRLSTGSGNRLGRNACGEPYSRAIPGDPYFNRVPVRVEVRRILFLGDSYTFAEGITSGKAYYDVFEQSTEGVSVFASGIGGYGTAQEYLALTRNHARITPQTVIWQLSLNDLVNNVLELERHDLRQNNGRPRPYFAPETDAFEVLDPSWRGLGWLMRHSQLTQLVAAHALELDARLGSPVMRALEHRLEWNEGRRQTLLRRGQEVLRSLIGRAAREFPDTEFLAFCASPDGEATLFESLRGERVTLLGGIGRAIGDAAATNCEPADFHWNHKGHRVAGELVSAAYRREQERSKGR